MVLAGALLALRHVTQQVTTKSTEPQTLCHIRTDIVITQAHGFLPKERLQFTQCSAIHFGPVPSAVSLTALLPLSVVPTELGSNPQIFTLYTVELFAVFLCSNSFTTLSPTAT